MIVARRVSFLTTCVDRSARASPYCTTDLLKWRSAFYTTWGCGTDTTTGFTFFAAPTVTGTGVPATLYPQNDPVDTAFVPSETTPQATSPTDDSGSNVSGGGGGGGGTSIGTVVGAVAGVLGAIAAIGLWFCTKRHFSRQRAYEVERDRGFSGSNSQELAIRGPGGMPRGGLNAYVHEFHYHNYGRGTG